MELSKENLKKKYLSENLSIQECSLFFNCSTSTINSRIRLWNLHKSKELASLRRKETNRKKYGVDFPFKSHDIQLKASAMHNYIESGRKIAETNAKKRKVLQETRKNLIQEKANEYEHIFGEKPILMELSAFMNLNHALLGASVKENNLQDLFRTDKHRLEQSVYEFLLSTGLSKEDIIWHDRTVIKPKELDFYIPAYKLAIEINDIASHNSTFNYYYRKEPKPKDFHFNKSMNCYKQGVRLIHIWDYELNDPRKRKIFESLVLSALNKCKKRYYARECEIHCYTQESARWKNINKFFEENNMQGNRGGTLAYTLEKDGQILMAYKFGKPFSKEAKKKYEYEMIRGAALYGIQVVGGASRMWSHFMNEVKPKSVVYYVDFNYFDGRSVEKLGGKLIGIQPGVKNYWVKENVVKNREPSKHKEIRHLIENKEVLELWNAGTKTYVFT